MNLRQKYAPDHQKMCNFYKKHSKNTIKNLVL